MARVDCQPNSLSSPVLDRARHVTIKESEVVVLTTAEQRVLKNFRLFQVAVGQMLCFHGNDLKRMRLALQQLTEKQLLVKEKFAGGYSLTPAGFAAMMDCC